MKLEELNEARFEITTLDQFVQKAKELDKIGKLTDMFDVFEDNTTEQVRTEIYKLADPKTPEPFRSAMINLGFTDY